MTPRRIPSPQRSAPVLTKSDLEVVVRLLTGDAPSAADLAAVEHLLGAAAPDDESSYEDPTSASATRR